MPSTPRKSKTPRKPTINGELTPWTPEEIDRMAQVTEEDKVSALAFWQANASRPMKTLLQAKRKRK